MRRGVGEGEGAEEAALHTQAAGAGLQLACTRQEMCGHSELLNRRAGRTRKAGIEQAQGRACS